MSSHPELRVLGEELYDVRSKWSAFGLQLNIPFPTLLDIEKSCRGDSYAALTRMLHEWREQEEEPSWAAIVEALRSRTVGETRLADNLQDRYAIGAATANAVVPRHHDQQLMLMPAAIPQARTIPDQQIQIEIDHLHQVFEVLRMEIHAYLEKSTPNLREFAVFVSSPMPSWKKKPPKRMTDINLDRIMQPNAEFYQMFTIVGQYTNWYNYELMDNIVQRYGDPPLKGKMASYREELAEFESHTSADEMKNVELAIAFPESVSVIATLPQHQCSDFAMSDVRNLKCGYARGAGLDQAAVRIHLIIQSSVEIIFLVPLSLAPSLVVSSFTTSPLLTSEVPVPEDMYERCVYYMNAEEVFRLMGRKVAPSAPHRTSSTTSQQEPDTPVFRSICSSVSISSESSRPNEIDGGAFPPIDPSRIHIYHNKVLMNGDSTVVCKAHFLNLPCAAKYVHQKLAELSTWQLENFKKGCQILKACRHPNIVTCLGIHSDNRLGRPILLMELMDQSLRQLMDHSKVDLPLYLQLDLCSDVARGLEYLHAKDIIHGNLTATNVLVKEGRAKICGAMSLQLRTTNAELSLCPGAPGSMPRRSFSHSDYDEAIDCFSFGVLGIHVATRELPKPRTQLHDECSEVERYAESLDKVPEGHLLLPLILKCLNDEGYQRPSAAKLCEELLDMIKTSAYRNSQAAEHISTELVSLQIEYMQDRLHEKTAENTALQKCRQAELNTANRETESLKNRVEVVVLRNADLEEKASAATRELDEIKKQQAEAVSEKDRMCKDLWTEKDTTQTMHNKIKDLEKERDTYKTQLEASDSQHAKYLSKAQ